MKEQPKIFEQDKLIVSNQDEHGAAQQQPPEEITVLAHRPIEEETKEPEPSQTIEPAGGATMSVPTVDASPIANQQPVKSVRQSADAN